MSEQLVQQLGLLGVFLAGATPWLEAVVVVPIAIAFGLAPVASTVVAVAGNGLTIALFAASSKKILAAVERRRESRGLPRRSRSMDRGRRIFDTHGLWAMAVVGPLLIGTQIAAALAVSLGISPWRASAIVTAGALVWTVAAATITAWITG